jgi:hypothetical protein
MESIKSNFIDLIVIHCSFWYNGLDFERFIEYKPMKYADKLKSYIGVEGEYGRYSGCSQIVCPASTNPESSKGVIKEVYDDFVIISIKEYDSIYAQYRVSEVITPLNLLVFVIYEKV